MAGRVNAGVFSKLSGKVLPALSPKRAAILALALSVAGVGALVSPANAATIDWTGASGTDLNWATAGNWSGTTTPPTNDLVTDIAHFGLNDYTGLQPVVSAAQSVSGILVDGSTTGGTALNIGGTAVLSLGAGGITLAAGTGNVTITAPINISYGQNWVNSEPTATLDFTGSTLTRSAGATLNVSGAGTTSTSLANDATGIVGPWMTFGTGTATQYATVNGSGVVGGLTGTPVTQTDVAGSTINSATTNYDLTTSANATTTQNLMANTVRVLGTGRTISLGNDGVSIGYNLATNGILNASSGTLTINDASATIPGSIVIGSSGELDILAAGGSITLSAPVTGTGNVIFNTTTGNNITFTSVLSPAGTLTFNAAGGTYFFNNGSGINDGATATSVVYNPGASVSFGSYANSPTSAYTGTTILNGTSFGFYNTTVNAFGATNNNVYIGSGSTIYGSSSSGGHTLVNYNYFVNGNFQININGGSGNANISLPGTWTLDNDATITVGSGPTGTSTITAVGESGGSRSLTVIDGTAGQSSSLTLAGTSTFTGALNAGNGVTPGNVTLSGDNNGWAGTILVHTGSTLGFNNTTGNFDDAIGSRTVTFEDGSYVNNSSGKPLETGATFNMGGTLNAYSYNTNLDMGANTVNLTAPLTVNFYSSNRSGQVTISNIGDGGNGYGVTMSRSAGAAGNLVIGGTTNSFTGDLTVGAAGLLTDANGNAVNTFAARTVSGSESNDPTAPTKVLTGATDVAGLVVGQQVSGAGIAAGTTITSFDTTNHTITLSNNIGVVATPSGTDAAGSTVITGVNSFTYLAPGMGITGPGIAAGTTIVSMDTVAKTVTLSQAATSSNTSKAFSFFGGTQSASFGDVNGNVSIAGNSPTWAAHVVLNPGGELQIGSTALGAGSTVTINGGFLTGSGTISAGPSYIFNGNFTAGPSNTLSLGTGTVTLSHSTTITLTNSNSFSIGGVVDHSGNVINAVELPGVAGSTLGFAGTNDFNGTLTVGNAALLTTATGTATTFTLQSLSGTEVTSSPIVTLPSTAGLVVGQQVTGTGITGVATIVSLDPDGVHATLSQSITGAGGAQTLAFGNVVGANGEVSRISLSGSSPNWAGNIVLNPSGTLGIENAAALGNSTVNINGGLLASYTAYGHYVLTTAPTFNFNKDFSFYAVANNSLDLGAASKVNLNAPITLTLTNNSTPLVLHNVSDGGHNYGLTVQRDALSTSGGTIEFSGNNNTFTGNLSLLNGASLLVVGGGSFNRDVTIVLDSAGTFGSDYTDTSVLFGGISDGPTGGGSVYAGQNGLALTMAGSGSYHFGGVIGTGSYPNLASLTWAGTGSQSLSGANVYSGATAIYSGTLNLDFSGPQAAGSLNDNIDPAYAGYQSDILYHNATPAGSGTFIANAGITLSGGTLQLTGKSGAQDLQRLSTIGIGTGATTVRLNANGATSLVLSTGATFNALANGSINFDLQNSGTQTATNGVLTTASNLNGIIAGNVLVTTAAGTDFAVSGATEVPGTWTADDDNSVIFAGNLANGTTVSFNTLSAGSGLTPGKLYYVVGSNGSSFKVVTTPGASSPALGATSPSGTNTIDTQGNITALATHTTLIGNGTSDLATDNAELGGSLTLTGDTSIYTLKIDNAATGTLDLGGKNLYLTNGALLFTGSADFTISDGALRNNQNIANHIIIEQYGTGNLTISAGVFGQYGTNGYGDSLVKTGPGTLTLTGSNGFGHVGRTYEGLFLEQGITNINGDAALGYAGSITFNGGTLQYQSPTVGALVDNGDITANPLSPASPVIILLGGATVDTNGNNITWANNFGGGDANNLVAGVPTGAFTKTGAGTLTLQGIGNYGGGTVVNDGTLLVSNTTGSATGSGKVTVNGGTLGGAGKIAGTVVGGTAAHTIAPSATLTGNTATTLTLGGLTTSSHTTLAFNLNTPYNTITHAASVSDKIVVNGNVNLTGGGTLSITNNNTGLASLGYYKAIGYTSLTAPSSPTANLGITMPTVANGIAYVLDTAHDPGFIDIHRGFLGDANDDGIVNAIDLGILATNYNSTTANWSEGDYNGDGIVNAIDLGILATNYNAVVGAGSFDAAIAANPTLEAAFGGASSVPEPASLALLGIGAAGLVTRRRRRA